MDSKPTNPKDIIGSGKIPVHLAPTSAIAYMSLGLLDGLLKYGRSNFRAVGVRASIYYDALIRHTMAWFEGEDIDPDSGLHHLCHVLACAAILVEAIVKDNLTDDRMYPTNYREMVEHLTPQVERLKAKYADRTPPHHYTIQDDAHALEHRMMESEIEDVNLRTFTKELISEFHNRGQTDILWKALLSLRHNYITKGDDYDRRPKDEDC